MKLHADKNSMKNILAAIAISLLTLTGCRSEDVPSAHVGRTFGRTGFIAFYQGSVGFTGDILKPGTHYMGIYNELKTVECTENTQKEPLQALTKDGVQFTIELYVRYSAACGDDRAVKAIMDRFYPEKDNRITSKQLYETLVKPALGSSVRDAISPMIANSINGKRSEIFADISARFAIAMNAQEPRIIVIHDVGVSNLDFPDDMDKANVDRAVQDVLKDKAIAERAKVTAEIETAKMKTELAKIDGLNEAAKIEAIGDALRRNPDFIAYNMQKSMPEIYRLAGEKGNMIIAAPNVVQFSARAMEKK